MSYPSQKQVCQLDENGFYLHTTFADLSPLEAEQGVYLLPANCVDVEPPEEKEGFLPKYEKGKWLYIADNRGTYYSTDTGEQVEHMELGELPKNLTTLPPLDVPCKWDGKAWVKDNEKLSALLNEQRALMWEKIKQKRYDNLRSGVFVKSIGKWFHSNDESRQQYTFLRTLSELPENLMWKTMDNSFVKVTKAILDELTLQLILDEQADFINAERHKSLMEQAENPLEYDFSSGWVRTFAEAVNE